MERLAGNPFAALFDSVQEAELFAQETVQQKQAAQEDEEVRLQAESEGQDYEQIYAADAAVAGSSSDATAGGLEQVSKEILHANSIIEKVFYITLNKGALLKDWESGRPQHLVFLAEMYESHQQEWLDTDCLERAVFERVMLQSPEEDLIRGSQQTARDHHQYVRASETNPLDYLFHCYIRLSQLPAQTQERQPVVDACRAVLLMNAKNCFQHPDFFTDLRPQQHFMQMFNELRGGYDFELLYKFMGEVSTEMDRHSDDGSVLDVFTPVLKDVQADVQKNVTLGQGTAVLYADMLQFFTCSPAMAKALIQYSQPRDEKTGRTYEQTILGCLLSLSCLPANEMGRYEFFESPSRYTQQQHNATELSIQQPTAMMNEKMYEVFHKLIRMKGEVQHLTLEWLANCLHANKGRAQLSQRMMMMMPGGNAGDGFFLNLCAVLLRLCRPFSQPRAARLLDIQPTYCLATAGDREQVRARNVHMKDLSKETSLVPGPEGENEAPQLDAEYKMVSEMFHVTHYALHLGFHVVHEKILKLNQELGRTQGLYRDLEQQGTANPTQLNQIKEAMEKRMQVYLSMKAALSEPQLLELCFNFTAATTTYLVQVAIAGGRPSDAHEFAPLSFPLSDSPPALLSCVPEFVGENVIDFMLFTRRFKDSLYEVMGSKLEPLLTFILVFMGSPARLRNPHLRAHMAEGLEALMPPQQVNQGMLGTQNFFRENLFRTHAHIRELAPTLLSVFCNIEMTGQGVEFEQKFNYRRPMYAILKYLWKAEMHRDRIKELADVALEDIEATTPPVFLRFINLLINDAIYLLDEALSYMSQIREKEEARDRGDWNALQARERQRTESDFRHMGMIARFHNIMGNETIAVLGMLTSHISNVFMHDVMVDRLAAMLNYFLKHLVGPRRKEFRVKDKEKYQFKPVELVTGICQVYLNFAQHHSFCEAVSKDGRSYSHELLLRAREILQRFGNIHMIDDFTQLADKIKSIAVLAAIEDEATDEAPDEFKDAMLFTLMRDPVMLPASRNVVDRATISRHLLSDQFDPFNRQPLTMDMVIPQRDLQHRIQSWLADWKQKRESETKTSQSETSGNPQPAESDTTWDDIYS